MGPVLEGSGTPSRVVQKNLAKPVDNRIKVIGFDYPWHEWYEEDAGAPDAPAESGCYGREEPYRPSPEWAPPAGGEGAKPRRLDWADEAMGRLAVHGSRFIRHCMRQLRIAILSFLVRPDDL